MGREERTKKRKRKDCGKGNGEMAKRGKWERRGEDGQGSLDQLLLP
jgi:hypothetical protein